MAGVHQKLLVLAGLVAGALSGNSSIFFTFSKTKILQTKTGVMHQINGSCHGLNPRFINNINTKH